MRGKKLFRLVKAACGGDIHAFAQLYHAFVKQMYYLALRLTSCETNAMVIVEQTMVRFYKDLTLLKVCGNVDMYLSRMIYDNSLELLQKNKTLVLTREPCEFGKYPWNEAAGFIPESFVTNAGRRTQIICMVEQLSAVQKAILVLYYFQGMDLEWISETMGMEAGIIEEQLFHARKNLKRQLEDVIGRCAPPSSNVIPALSRIMKLDAEEVFSPQTSNAMRLNIGTALNFDAHIFTEPIGKPALSVAVATLANERKKTARANRILSRMKMMPLVASIAVVSCLSVSIFYADSSAFSWDKSVYIADEPPPLAMTIPDNNPAGEGSSTGIEDAAHKTFVQPSIVAKKIHLIYPQGRAITPKQIITDAGIVATNSQGQSMELIAAGLVGVDPSVPGSHKVLIYPPSMQTMQIEIIVEIA